MSAASRNDMAGLQRLEDSLVEKIGGDATVGSRRRTVRSQVAALHAQGAVLEDAAKALGVSVEHARVAANQLGLRFKTEVQRSREDRNETIRQGYAAGLPTAEIAKSAGVSLTTVHRAATRMGVAQKPEAVAINRRGFAVPEHLKEDYRILTRSRIYRSREAGIALGLLEAEQ